MTVAARRDVLAPVPVPDLQGLVRSVREPALVPGPFTPMARPVRPSPRRVLPLRLARQPIALSRLPGQPRNIVLRVVPIHAHGRMKVRLVIARVPPIASGTLLPLGALERPARIVAGISRVAHERRVLSARHLGRADRKRRRDDDAVSRPFVPVALLLGGRRTHDVGPGRHHDELRAVVAVAEDLPDPLDLRQGPPAGVGPRGRAGRTDTSRGTRRRPRPYPAASRGQRPPRPLSSTQSREACEPHGHGDHPNGTRGMRRRLRPCPDASRRERPCGPPPGAPPPLEGAPPRHDDDLPNRYPDTRRSPRSYPDASPERRPPHPRP